MAFVDLGLGSDVLRAVDDAGYTEPTPIQRQAIPVILGGRDVMACAQTGTGKTASFTLPMIDILANGRAKARMPRSLILEPTRELAAQVSENFDTYGKYHRLSMALLIGGEGFSDQVKRLDRGVDVLIATPGRMIDLYERGSILLSDIKILVIDEADRMLDMGFIPDIERIVGLLPRTRQTLMFSATMPAEIRRLADQFLVNPQEIAVTPPASPAQTVTQRIVVVADENKRKALREILRSEDVKNAFIFCNRKRDVSVLCNSLERHGFRAGALHGDLPQHVRTETLDAFRRGDVSLLVCSDVAARGLDIDAVSHVFNFDIPLNAEDYIHRIGRTGRAGRSGVAYSIAGAEDGRVVAAIETLLGKEIEQVSVGDLPTIPFAPEDEVAHHRRDRRRRTSVARPQKIREKQQPDQSRSEGRRWPTTKAEPHPGMDSHTTDQVASIEPMLQVPAAMVVAAPVARNSNRPSYSSRRGSPRAGDQIPDHGTDEAILGFGDHVPAFIMRKIPDSRLADG